MKTQKIAAAVLIASLAAIGAPALAQSVPYIDVRPIHLVPTKDELYRQPDTVEVYSLGYPALFPALGANGEPISTSAIDESTNTFNADGSLDVEYNQYLRWLTTGMGTRIYYKYNTDKVFAAAGASSSDWWLGAYLCEATETPQVCDARLFANWGDSGYPVFYSSMGPGRNGVSSEQGMGWFGVDPVTGPLPVGNKTATYQGIKQYYMLFVGRPKSATTVESGAASRRIFGVGEPITLRFVPGVSEKADVLAQQWGGCSATDKARAYRGTIIEYTESQRQSFMSSTTSSHLARRLRHVDDRNMNGTLGHSRELAVQLNGSGVPTLVEKGSSATSQPVRVEVLNRGKLSSRSMSVTITPATADEGKTGNFYVAADVNGQLFGYSQSGGWALWNGQSVFSGSVPLTKTTIALTSSMNLTGLDGIKIHAGYGTSLDDMLANQKYALQAALLQKDPTPRVRSNSPGNPWNGYISPTCPSTH